jgi:nucleoid-associated protein YgaU
MEKPMNVHANLPGQTMNMVQQPAVNMKPNTAVSPGAIEKIPVTPVVTVEPRFMEHLLQCKGKQICTVTTADQYVGIVKDAFVDHFALAADGKKLHIRYDQIVCFYEV